MGSPYVSGKLHAGLAWDKIKNGTEGWKSFSAVSLNLRGQTVCLCPVYFHNVVFFTRKLLQSTQSDFADLAVENLLRDGIFDGGDHARHAAVAFKVADVTNIPFLV